MKTLGKLKINIAKMLNNKELINLKRGGYGSVVCNGVTCTGSCNGNWSCNNNQCTCNNE